MPVLCTANPKGGSGKTTTATLLAYTAAYHGASVALIDCDPNQPHKGWVGTPEKPRASKIPVEYHFARDETELMDLVSAVRKQRQLVVVDLEGVANLMMSHAIAMSDLVLIPMAPTDLDAKEARRAVTLVKQQERLLNRSIAHGVVFTDTEAKGATVDEKEMLEGLRKVGVRIFKTQLHRRSAFTKVFKLKLGVHELDPKRVSNLSKAIENADAFADEVGLWLKEIADKRKAA